VPGDYTFPRSERILHSAEFERVFGQGEKLVCGAFVCYVDRQTGQGRKLGCVVSRRVGNAVVRNRVKRNIREVYRLHRPDLAVDVHLVVVARQAAARMRYGECAEALCRLLRKGDVLRG